MAHLQLVEGKGVTFEQLEDFIKDCKKTSGIPNNAPIKVSQNGGGNSPCTCIIAEEDGITLYDWI